MDKREAPPIGRDEVLQAAQTLREYKNGKSALERRIVANEQWWKLRHWQQMNLHDPRETVEPVSAWLFNIILNKHADAMDNRPEPVVLPREEGDRGAAETLSQVLPVILEQGGMEQLYSDMWWYKLKAGTGAAGVFWDPDAAGGLGDVALGRIDLLQLFWEPGIRRLQDSRNVFYTMLEDREELQARYPFLELRGSTPGLDVTRYVHDDQVETGNKAVVVDWYYRRRQGNRTVLHYCRFVEDQVIFASENEPAYAKTGFYEHGEYPFVLDPLFPVEDSPAGFGYIDVLKDCQTYIDRLNQALLKNALLAGKKRFFIRQDGAVSEGEFADWRNDFVHVAGNLSEDAIREITVQPLSGLYTTLLEGKINEMKETSGVRDFTQGGVTGGVTAGTAIAALQEAGSKLSRDMIQGSYRAFTRICELCVELIRQFYDVPRYFRIMGQGGMRFLRFDNGGLKPRALGNVFGQEMGQARPVYDIKLRSQKASPYNKIVQNELAKELFGMGLFRPEMADQARSCLEMMDFEGKDMLLARLEEQGGLQRQVEELKGRLQQLGQVVDRMKGTTIAPAVAQQVQTDSPAPQEQPEQQDTQSKQAAETAAGQATPK